MRAVCIEQPGRVVVKELPAPRPFAGEALLQVCYGGICGADLASYLGNQPFTTYPRIPGHEFSARIVEVPDNDRGLKKGDLVTANPYFNCGHCYSCCRGLVNACESNQTMGVQRDGAFCELISMPLERIVPGKGLTARQLALIEPFAISWHAVERGKVGPGAKVLVVGAGPIGLFALVAARAKGASVYVSDVLDGRLEKAKALGAAGVVNTASQDLAGFTARVTGGNGFDVTIEACGKADTFLACVEQAAFGGDVVLIGNGKQEATFLHSVLLKKELNLYGSRNAHTWDFTALIDYVAAGSLDILQLVSGSYPLEEAGAAFEALAHNDGSLVKLLVHIA